MFALSCSQLSSLLYWLVQPFPQALLLTVTTIVITTSARQPGFIEGLAKKTRLQAGSFLRRKGFPSGCR